MQPDLQSHSQRLWKPAIATAALLSALAVGAVIHGRSQPTALPLSSASTADPSAKHSTQPHAAQPAPASPNLTPSNPATIEVLQVSQPVINAYADPSQQAEVVTQAIYGEPAEILTKSGDWLEVAFPDQSHYSGWIPAATLSSTQVNPTDLPRRRIVTAPTATVHAAPQESAKVLKQLQLGSLVDDLGAQGVWTEVRLARGGSGYVWSDHMAAHNPENSPSVPAYAIADTAKQLLGQPYLWGGMTTDGVDCSGFIHTVFKTHGIRLHRDADQQFFNDGFPVERNTLQVGDLVFFETYAPGPSHVGIFLGNDQFIQAGSSSGVVISSLSEPYFSSRFLGARRIEGLIQARRERIGSEG